MAATPSAALQTFMTPVRGQLVMNPMTGSVEVSDSTGSKSGKKHKYSLKKFLDKKRFSPLLMRFGKNANKGGNVGCDNDDNNCSSSTVTRDKNGTVPKVNEDSSVATGSVDCSTPSGSPTLSNSIRLSVAVSDAVQPLNGTVSDREAVHNHEIVEEAYEESLTHIADLILDGTGVNSEDQSSMPLNNCSIPSSSQLVITDVSHGSFLNNQLAGPSSTSFPDHRSDKSAVSLSIPIYNEPCDMKFDGSTTIYTVANLTVDQFHESPKALTEFDKVKSSSSGENRNDPPALQRTGQVENFSVMGQSNGSHRLQSASPSSSTGSQQQQKHLSTTRFPINNGSRMTEQNAFNTDPSVGFVEVPRGNTSLTHHPASPFARVPRGSTNHTAKSSSSESSSVDRSPSRSSVDSAHTGQTNDQHTSPVQAQSPSCLSSNQGKSSSSVGSIVPESCIRISPPPKSFSPIAAKNNPVLSRTDRALTSEQLRAAALQVSGVSSSGFTNSSNSRRFLTDHGQQQSASDVHPTYEEAWDVKMARQLGFGMSRLAPPGAGAESRQLPKFSPVPPDTQQHRDLITHCRSGYKPDSPNLTDQSKRFPPERDETDSIVSSSLRHSGRSVDRNEPSKLIQNSKAALPPDPKSQPSSAAAPQMPSEYEYAYNGSWSMGVQFNLNLSLNESPQTADPRPVTKSNRIWSPDDPLPAVPSHRRMSANCPRPCDTSHLKGKAAVGRPSLPTSTISDFDNVSSDSYGTDSTWDAKHGKVISELTSSRFVDPSAVIPDSTFPSSCETQQLRTTRADVGQFDCCNLPSAPLCTSTAGRPTAFKQATVNLGLMMANFEHLPLEQQPWYHPRLTRSEAEELLQNEPDGSFLVRDSETCPADYSLTIKHSTYLHMKITRTNSGHFILGEYSQPYSSVPQMVYHYARSLVPVRGAESVTLSHPVCFNRVPSSLS